ncbi:MAG: TonB-dependent receptor [Xanthomonadales bacterium]|nr:TonB-dependent receptor [Xanthomonadales bacterium]
MRPSNNELYKAIRAGLAVGVVGLVGVTGAAVAQDARTLDRVEVVGSRIKRVEAETSQPIFQVSQEEIRATGLTSIGDVIQNLTANGAALGTTFNNGGDGSSRVSLRNLGTARTLVLVNGRRWVGTGTGGNVDLNSIPTAAVESVQILKDGASAIYGSDAIAGVVDIRLKSNYVGAEMSAQIGEFTDGDGRRSKYDFIIGFDGDRGNVMMGAGYVKEEAVMAGDRAISRVPAFGLPAEDTSFAGASGIRPAPRLFIPGVGQLSLIPGRPGSSPDDYRPFNAATDGYNFAPENYLQTPQERVSFFMDGRYQVIDGVEFYTQATFNERKSEQLLAAFPLSGGVFNSNPNFGRIVIPATNVYNPFGVAITGFGRRVTDVGGRSFNQDVDTYNFIGGFQGDFMVGDRFFGWDVGYQYAKSERRDQTFGLQTSLNVERALGPSFIDAQGVARCGTPTAVIAGCVPLNIFGPLGTITPEMGRYINYIEQANRDNTLTNYWANISGDLFEIVDARPVAFAAGYEYRRDFANDIPDSFTNAGLGSGNARTPTSGGFSVDEFYVELNAPLLADLPFAYLLEARAAARYSDYSNFGDTLNTSFGLKWQPIEDLAIRGNYAEGFRAPSVNNLFQGLSDSFPTVLDPCSEPRFSQQPAEVQARCIADGVTPGYTQLSSQIRITVGGNPFLQPEVAKTKTLGLVYSPGFLNGFDITLDWYNIEIEDGIATQGGNFIIQSCYTGATQAVRDFYCPRVQRAPGGVVTDILATPLNFAGFEVEGWDLTLRYNIDTDWGRFGIVSDTTYTTKWFQKILNVNTGNVDVTQRAGRELGNDAYHRVRSNLNVNWALGDWGINWGARYFHHADEPCFFDGIEAALGVPNPCTNPADRSPLFPQGRNRQASTTYHDVRFTWNTPWDGQIGLGINNVFEKDPPVSYEAFANSFNAAQHEVPGRFWYVQYNQRF